jgi:hypothetical protein
MGADESREAPSKVRSSDASHRSRGMPFEGRSAVVIDAAAYRTAADSVFGLNASHDTFGFQFAKVPFGLSFHAHTCSV